MTTIVAGGITEDAGPEVAVAPGDKILVLRYAQPSLPASPTGSYVVYVSGRLSAVLRPGEQGWIACAAELDALGYGATWDDALVDLADSVEQYLEYLRDERPELTPGIAHHSAYVELLDTPRKLWFASVSVDAPALE